MPLNKGKHIVEEIQGVRCTLVENGADKNRADFLKRLLEYNKLEVLMEEEPKKEEGAQPTYRVGVTDILFNPVLAVYEHLLYTPEGIKVSPAYWNQWKVKQDVPYWKLKESNLKPKNPGY